MTIPPYPKVDGRAPCTSGNPERFFPPPGSNGYLVEHRKKECTGCPFKDPCLAYALHRELSGIWGGTSESERRTMRRKLGIRAIPLAFGMGPTNRTTALRMAGRGTPVSVIARHLELSEEAVHRIVREARAS